MKKRILASLMALCLIVGLLPATALAADEKGIPALSNLYVNNIALISEGSITENTVDGATYEVATNTLYLNNANIESGYTYDDTENKNAGIYGDGDLNISLSGDNTISGTSLNKGIFVKGNLAVDGAGNLTSAASGIYADSILMQSTGQIAITSASECLYSTSGDIDIQSGTFNLSATSNAWAQVIGTNHGGLNICGAKIDISAPADDSATYTYGVYTNGNIVIEDAEISSTAKQDSVYVKGNIFIKSGSVHAPNGIRAQNNGSIYVNNGEVTVGGRGFDATDSIYLLDGKINFDGDKLSAYNTIFIDKASVVLSDEITELKLQGTTYVLNQIEDFDYKLYNSCNSYLDYNSDAIAYVSDINTEDQISYHIGIATVNNKEVNYVRGHFAYNNGGVIGLKDLSKKTERGLITPTKSKFEFGGWYETADYSGDAVTIYSEGKTYYAKWNYIVDFDANGGEGSMTAQQVTEGDTSTKLTTNGFTKTGYTFTGWNTAADGKGTSYGADAVASTVPNGTTLYAQWTPNTYTIQFSGGTGASGSTANVTATYDKPVTLPANGFTMAGKNFAGWAKEAAATEAEYSDQTEVLNLAASGTVTLYAVWTEKKVLDPDLTDTVVTYTGKPQKFHVDDTYTVKYYQNREEVTDPTNAGIYDVEITRAEDEDYAAYHGRIMGGLVINKAPLTIKADNQSIRVGDQLPKFTYTVSGWQGSDGDTATIEGVSAVCTNADANTVGEYTITVSGPKELDNYTIIYQSGTLTVSRRSSGGGSGSGGSGTTTTETERNPDGSTTTTVIDKKTGTVTETTKYKDGSTLVVETQKDGTVTTTETARNGVKVKTVDEPGEDVTAKITVPKSVGEAVVTIPADADYGMVAVDARTGEVVKLSVPTGDGMTVRLDGSAELVLVDRSRGFTDTRDHWAEDAIDFATAHELFAGTGDTTFSPDSPMTRAMLMTVLARFDGQDITGGAVWYEKAMAWAKENGISDGSAPDSAITREQLAAMLWRYAGSPAGDGSLSAFGDSAGVSGYAVEAMRWAVGEGLISGTDAGLLAPQGSATRAQVATILMRFVESLTK